MTKPEKHGSPVGKTILRRAWFIASASEDKTCFSREAHTIAAEKNAEPYFELKENAIAESKEHPAYRETMKKREEDEEARESA